MIAKPPAVWALETNYPAGARLWNGQPCKVAPAGDTFLPNVKIPAEVLNLKLNEITTEQGAGNDRDTAAALGNFRPRVAVASMGSATRISDISWDPFGQRWIGNANSSGAGIPVSYDGGQSWVNWGSVNAATGEAGLVINPNTGDVFAMYDKAISGLGGGLFYPYTTGVGASVGAPAGTTWGQSGVGAYFPVGLKPWHFFGYNGGAPNINNFFWTLGTSATPPVLSDNSSAAPGAWTGSANPGNLTVAASPTALVVAICGVLGTGTPRLGCSLDGLTMADVTPSFMAGKTISGLHYSSVDGLFGLLAYDGTSSYLYTSSTPNTSTSWTLCKTFTSRINIGLTSIGRAWAVGSQDSALALPVRLLFSQDVALLGGASTWRAAAYLSPTGTFKERSFKSSGQQVLNFTNTMSITGPQAGANPSSAAF